MRYKIPKGPMKGIEAPFLCYSGSGLPLKSPVHICMAQIYDADITFNNPGRSKWE